MTFNVVVKLPTPPLQLPRIGGQATSIQEAAKASRMAYSPLRRAFIPHAVYDRYRLFPGASLEGPAIIEERESTTLVGEDASVQVDQHGFLMMKLKGA